MKYVSGQVLGEGEGAEEDTCPRGRRRGRRGRIRVQLLVRTNHCAFPDVTDVNGTGSSRQYGR